MRETRLIPKIVADLGETPGPYLAHKPPQPDGQHFGRSNLQKKSHNFGFSNSYTLAWQQRQVTVTETM